MDTLLTNLALAIVNLPTYSLCLTSIATLTLLSSILFYKNLCLKEEKG